MGNINQPCTPHESSVSHGHDLRTKNKVKLNVSSIAPLINGDLIISSSRENINNPFNIVEKDINIDIKETTLYDNLVNKRVCERILIGNYNHSKLNEKDNIQSNSKSNINNNSNISNIQQLACSYVGMLRVGLNFNINPPKTRDPCEDAIVTLPLINNNGLVISICDGHFPESSKKPFDNCLARAGRFVSTKICEEIKKIFDPILSNSIDALDDESIRNIIKEKIADAVKDIDLQFAKEQFNMVINHSLTEKLIHRGLLNRRTGPNVSKSDIDLNPLLTNPFSPGFPSDDGCTMVVAIVTPKWFITANVGDSRAVLIRSNDFKLIHQTVDQDASVVDRIRHIIKNKGMLLKKIHTPSGIRLSYFIPSDNEKIAQDNIHFESKIFREARIALPEEFKSEEILPPRYFKSTKTLNLAGVVGDITFKVDIKSFLELKKALNDIEVYSNLNDVEFLKQMHPDKFKIIPVITAPVINSIPDIEFIPLKASDVRYILVIASDGLWQYMKEDISELLGIISPHYPAVFSDIKNDINSLIQNHKISLESAGLQRNTLLAELEENPKSNKRLLIALHKVLNDLNSFVLSPAKVTVPIRDDFSALVMDIHLVSGLNSTLDSGSTKPCILAATCAGIGGTIAGIDKDL